MNKLSGILLIAAAACATATAQDGNQQSEVTGPSASRARLLAQVDQVVQPAPGFKLVLDFPRDTGFHQTRTTTEGSGRGEAFRQTVVLLPTVWLWKDGAVYVDMGMFGNGMLIPVPGGGASGCFESNLPERIEKLRTSIEAFPARPLPATPPRR